MSNLVEHTKSELRLLGYTGEEPEDDPNRWMWDSIVGVVEKFAEGGHSGTSAAYALDIIEKVLQFKNLSPLTDDPAEWNEVSGGLWQSSRRSDAFSSDKGKTYYCLDDRPSVTRISEPHESPHQ